MKAGFGRGLKECEGVFRECEGGVDGGEENVVCTSVVSYRDEGGGGNYKGC